MDSLAIYTLHIMCPSLHTAKVQKIVKSIKHFAFF